MSVASDKLSLLSMLKYYNKKGRFLFAWCPFLSTFVNPRGGKLILRQMLDKHVNQSLVVG